MTPVEPTRTTSEFPRGPSRISTGSWVLYDLANTIFSFNIVSFYFVLWVTNVMGGTDADYGYVVSISMAVIFLLSPLLGALTDQAPRRMPFLVISTMICVGLTLLLGSGGLMASLAFFAFANVAYLAGLQFYDALLPDVSTDETRGRVSGNGIGIGYLGSFIGLAVGYMILGSDIDDPSLPVAEQAARYRTVFLMTGVLFLTFAIPCFLFVRERGRPGRRFSWSSVGAAFRQVATTFRHSRRYPGLLRFLIGRMFYTDAVNTVIIFMGVYVVNEMGFGTQMAQVVLLVAILFAVVGGLVWGRIVDRIGPKRSLTFVLRLWMFVLSWTALVGFLPAPEWTFWPVPVLAGIALGGTGTADRPLMLCLTPPARIGEFYGLYGMVGRFAAIFGPALWGLIVNTLGLGRPVAVTTLLVAILISYAILRPVSDEPRDWPVEERLPA